MINPRMKKTTPVEIAIEAISLMNLSPYQTIINETKIGVYNNKFTILFH